LAFYWKKNNIFAFYGKSQNIGFFALIEENMNRNGIDDQNNDDIIDILAFSTVLLIKL